MVNNLSYLLKIVIHNKINFPLYLDVPVPPEFVAALRTSPITMAEFLISGIGTDRKSTRLNSSQGYISYAVFCLEIQYQVFVLILYLKGNDFCGSMGMSRFCC